VNLVDLYPEHAELGQGMHLYVDAEDRALLLTAGEIDRFEMVDRVYMTVAPILGVEDFEARLVNDAGREDSRMLTLALRVEWRSIRTVGEACIIGPSGGGAPVTVCNLEGLVEAYELSSN
jgi:hypothetical protein